MGKRVRIDEVDGVEELTVKCIDSLNRHTEQLAVGIYELGAEKHQSCIVLISALGAVLGNTIDQLSEACEVPLSDEQRKEMLIEFESVCNKYVKVIYDAADGVGN